MGYPPDRKYEKDGGPGMEACLRLLDGSADAEVDRLSFQLTQLAFWLMVASDGHAKNYSLFLRQADAHAMTPLYDVISVWPYIGDSANQFRRHSAGLAMAPRARNAHHTFHSIRTRHWHYSDGALLWIAINRQTGAFDAYTAMMEKTRWRMSALCERTPRPRLDLA